MSDLLEVTREESADKPFTIVLLGRFYDGRRSTGTSSHRCGVNSNPLRRWRSRQMPPRSCLAAFLLGDLNTVTRRSSSRTT
jgi:hypothetical protein